MRALIYFMLPCLVIGGSAFGANRRVQTSQRCSTNLVPGYQELTDEALVTLVNKRIGLSKLDLLLTYFKLIPKPESIYGDLVLPSHQWVLLWSETEKNYLKSLRENIDKLLKDDDAIASTGASVASSFERDNHIILANYLVSHGFRVVYTSKSFVGRARANSTEGVYIEDANYSDAYIPSLIILPPPSAAQPIEDKIIFIYNSYTDPDTEYFDKGSNIGYIGAKILIKKIDSTFGIKVPKIQSATVHGITAKQ